jgi:two-component system chemotaxis response regulator CheY
MALKVLLVDDSAVMRKMITRTLRQAGIDLGEVLEASNGVEALEVLTGHVVDLILCDWNMPEMDGLTFLKEARKQYQTPVVMLTTESSQEKISEAMAAGANAYISKPFTPEKIGTSLSQVLGT